MAKTGLYNPKPTTQEKIGFILIILGGILVVVQGLGLIFVILGLVVYYYGREQCPYCKVRGKIRGGRSDIVNQERGFGLVTRTEHAQGRVGRHVQQSMITRQERVPVVNRVTRVEYVCTNCQKPIGTKDFFSQQEDFSAPTQTIVQRETQGEGPKDSLQVLHNATRPDP